MEKNPTKAENVVKPSVVPVLLRNIKKFILGKNLMNVGNVEKPLAREYIFLSIRESILE